MPPPLTSVILLGGSAGGLEAVTRILPDLEADLPAAVFVVLHLGRGPAPVIESRLTSAGPFNAAFATHGEPVEAGRIYVAPPDHHTFVQDGTIHLTRGPRVNRARPAIDLTFRSAAVAYRAQTLGVLVSGMLDDGVAGLDAIKRCGGITIVQDPTDARSPSMPLSALAGVDVDHTLPASAIGPLLNQLARTPGRPSVPLPPAIALENRFDLSSTDDLRQSERLGGQTPLGCPECGGPLRELSQGRAVHYRCHTGHSMSARHLVGLQDEEVEKCLWIAIRTLEEKARILRKLARREDSAGDTFGGGSMRDREAEALAHAQRLRQLLFQVGAEEPSPGTESR